jgi:hypothetical protein
MKGVEDTYEQLITFLEKHKAHYRLINHEPEGRVDPSLLANEEIYFNVSRLDRSMALKTTDYLALSKPRIKGIVMSTDMHQN